jgi:hypothetical protein
MAPKDTLQKLLQDLPNSGQFQLQREGSISSAVRITGFLKGRDNDGVVVQSGRRFFVVAEDDIVAIEKLAPVPQLKLDDVEVAVDVKKDATVKVVAFVAAEDLRGHIGMKPLVYDIPSRAHEFIAEGHVVDTAHARWMKQTGLEGFPGVDDSDTGFKTTYYPTYKQTSRQTTSLTGTSNNDTQTDYQTDWVTDTFQDPSLDSE